MAHNIKDENKYIGIITSISCVAAAQVEGVASVSCEPGSMIDTIAPKSRSTSKSVKVEIMPSGSVVIDICINAKFGFTVPKLVCELQETIKSEVEKATSYKVKAVNVNIVGVAFSN